MLEDHLPENTTKAALIKNGSGRLFIALYADIESPVVRLIYNARQDFLSLRLSNDQEIEIARDLDAEFSAQITAQRGISIVHAAREERHHTKVPITIV